MSATVRRFYENDAAAAQAVAAVQNADLKTLDNDHSVATGSMRRLSFGDLALATASAILIVAGVIALLIPGVGAIVFGAVAGWMINRAMRNTVEISAQRVPGSGVLVTARVPDARRARVEAILNRTSDPDAKRTPAHRSLSSMTLQPKSNP